MNLSKINIFETDYPENYRWDNYKNSKLINIIFQGGTFGNFLKFFLDKFSKLTPDIQSTPFNDIGTSHKINEKSYSGLIQRYHPSFINDNEGETGLPICLILPNNEKDFLFLKTSQIFRVADKKNLPDHLWQNTISKNKNSEELKHNINKILSLYKNNTTDERIPKFIVRDFYKLEFLENLETTHDYQWFKTLKDHPFFKKQRVFHLPLSSFFNFKDFILTLKNLDNFFSLQLDFTRIYEMEDIFITGLELDSCRKQTNLTFEIIANLKKETNIKIPPLDVSFEAFLYAYIEKTYSFMIAPLTNYFFQDTDEIRSFVKSYPEHYKAMNPNLPKFNGIDNPFYLWNLKNKG